MKSARLAVRKAALAAIEAKMTAEGESAEVFANAVQAQSLPYVLLGSDTETDQSDKTEDVSEMTLTPVVWSESIDEALRLAGYVQEALTAGTLLTLEAPFAMLQQRLDIGLAPLDQSDSGGPLHGVPIRVRFTVCHQ